MRNLAVVGVLLMAGLSRCVAAEVVLSATVQADFGTDLGQNFGTLFEVRDASGRALLGAGFAGVFNTSARLDRYQLQCYVRPPVASQPTLTPLPKPRPQLSGSYVFDLEGELYAQSYTAPRRWDAGKQEWQDAPELAAMKGTFGDCAMRVGRGLLVFGQGVATYDGQPILPPPAAGAYCSLYYALGHLLLYQTQSGAEGFTRLLAIPWKPGDGLADLGQAKTVACRYVGETPFVWGQLRDKALTVSNNGGLYVFDGSNWEVLREADKSVSYQVYSSVNYYDDLLLAQYPTGNLFRYNGREVTQLANWPPVPPGVSTGAREAQSTMLYGGELYVGVWPWAELWRYDRDADRWVFVSRMFSQPPAQDRYTHPFEAEVVQYNAATGGKVVINDWGQRLCSMAPWRDSLLLGTSSKGPRSRDPKFAAITDEIWAEYGRVMQYTLPGNLAAPLAPTTGPTRLTCTLTTNALRLEQDGKLLAETPLDPALVASLKPAEIVWGRGLFGRTTLKLTERQVTPSLGR